MSWDGKNKNVILPSFATFTPVDKRKKIGKKILKEILRWTKILVYLFMISMGLYGCGQWMAEYWVSPSTQLGSGLEVGFLPGTTGNLAFDLTSINGKGAFYPFADFSFEYGPFYALFVWPFAQLLLLFMYATRGWPAGLNSLVGIVIILVLIRCITLIISTRSSLQSEKMSELQGRIAEINAKYKDAKDMQSRQKKQLEVQELYKKHSVKPFAAFEQVIVTIPIFLIIFRVINIVRPLKTSVLFDIWDLTLQPISQIFSKFTSGGWTYIFFLLFVIPTQFISQKIPQRLAKKRSRGARTVGVANNKQLNKTKTIQNVMTIFMAVVTAVTATGIGLYWFFNALLSIAQSYFLHKLIMKKRGTKKELDSKLEKLGIV